MSRPILMQRENRLKRRSRGEMHMLPSHAAQSPGTQNPQPRGMVRPMHHGSRQLVLLRQRQFLQKRRRIHALHTMTLRRPYQEIRWLRIFHRKRYFRHVFLFPSLSFFAH